MLSDQHHFSPARRLPPTGGRRHSTSHSRTQHRSTHGEWSHRLPVQPLQPAVRHSHPSGAPSVRLDTKPSSCRPRHRRSASRTTRAVPTRRVRTTARPQHRPRYLLFLCRAYWPSNVVPAPCTVDSAVSGGTQGSQHSTQRLPKRDKLTLWNLFLRRWQMLGARTWPVPLAPLLTAQVGCAQPCDARHETNAMCTTSCTPSLVHQSMGRRCIDLATLL
jgi:hypothetical protein